jgi:hypothetical protein
MMIKFIFNLHYQLAGAFHENKAKLPTFNRSNADWYYEFSVGSQLSNPWFCCARNRTKV